MLDAALEAGFGSYPQFHRVFKRVIGCSPAKHHTRRQADLRRDLFPELINLAAQNFCVLPTVREASKARSRLSTGPSSGQMKISRPESRLPSSQHLSTASAKGSQSLNFPRQIPLPVRDRHLRVMAIERAKMKLLRALNQIGPHKHPLDKIVRAQMFTTAKWEKSHEIGSSSPVAF